MTVLVTGASGFVGSAVVRRLLAGGLAVRALMRPRADRRNIQGLNLDIAAGDLTDPESLNAAARGCSAVFHVAADYRLWVPEPAAIYEANVEGTRNLMRAALKAGVGRIVYTSSVATLGLARDGQVADEATPSHLKDMIGHYKRSKFLAEAEVRRMVAEEKLPAVIVNPSAPVGPRDVKPTPTGKMIADAAAGRMPAYVDTGLNIVHVDDVAEGHLLAYERGRVGERYVLGGENMTLIEIFRQVAEATGKRPPSIRLPHAAVLPVAYLAEIWARLGRREPIVSVDSVRMAKKRMFFSSAKATRELGYAPRPAGAAIRDAVAWFRQNGYLGA